MKPLVIITGPTGCGKSKTGIEIAKRINGEIISCDSMQIYKGLDVGTAKVTGEEQKEVVHHMIDIITPDTPYSVNDYVKDAKKCSELIYENGKIPVLVGGTGLYADSFLMDIDFSKDCGADEKIREELSVFAEENGCEALHEMLRRIDPESADAISCQNTKRVIRAIEYYRQTGETISEHNRKSKEKPSPYNCVYIVLTRDRAELYKMIDERVDKMMDEGLLDEAKRFFDSKPPKDVTSVQAIGYKELFDFFKGECELSDAIELIKTRSRRYAKRQMTWFRRNKDAFFINLSEISLEEAIEKIIGECKKKGVVL